MIRPQIKKNYMKIHIPQNGDLIKILPMIDEVGSISWLKPLDAMHIDGQVIYDISDRAYLKKISRLNNHFKRTPVSSRYYMNVFAGGEIRILQVGRTLLNIVQDNPKLFELKSNCHLSIVREESHGYPNYDKSYVVDFDWTPPVQDIDSSERWINYIKTNQPDLTSHINNNSLYIHRSLLIKHFGRDFLSELISDNRQKILNDIL